MSYSLGTFRPSMRRSALRRPRQHRMARRNRSIETLESRALLAADSFSWPNLAQITSTAPVSNADFVSSSDLVDGSGGDGLGDLGEVDVIHLGGNPASRTGSYVVTGVGSGGSSQLTSWRVTAAAVAPQQLGPQR